MLERLNQFGAGFNNLCREVAKTTGNVVGGGMVAAGTALIAGPLVFGTDSLSDRKVEWKKGLDNSLPVAVRANHFSKATFGTGSFSQRFESNAFQGTKWIMRGFLMKSLSYLMDESLSHTYVAQVAFISSAIVNAIFESIESEFKQVDQQSKEKAMPQTA